MNFEKIIVGAFLAFVLLVIGVFVEFLPKELESTQITAQITNLVKTDRYKRNHGTIYFKDLTNNTEVEIPIYRKRKIHFPNLEEVKDKTFQTTRTVVQYHNGTIEVAYPDLYCDMNRVWNFK